jgi:transposase
MKFIEGQNRAQLVLIPTSLDALIDADNEVRTIDLFVDSLDIKDFGFAVKESLEGRPAYHPKVLLKLFIYGYLNRIRSSRALEKECSRNIELMWLLKQLTPDHNTISNFRKDNAEGIRKVFQATVSIAKYFNLIGGKLIAGDSTKLRAQNSKKNNFNQGKIDRHLAYIEQKIELYQQELAEADGDQKKELHKAIKQQKQRKEGYVHLQAELNKTGQEQISISDPDSRQMVLRNTITEVAYNVQSTTDAKHCLPIDYLITNNNDSKALGNMVQRASNIVGNTKFTAVFDKGYHKGSELKAAQLLGVKTLVAIPDISSASMAPDPAYNVSEFIYTKKKNTYTCPQGHTLTTNGNWYQKSNTSSKRKNGSTYLVQHYKTPACKICPLIACCTKNTGGRGRVIERSEYQEYVDQNRKNIAQNEAQYKLRQSIIEHNYGTIKRQWNFHFILTKKGINRAASDVGFMFVAYNLKRLLNLIDKKDLLKYLKRLAHLFFAQNALFRGVIRPFNFSYPFYPTQILGVVFVS